MSKDFSDAAIAAEKDAEKLSYDMLSFNDGGAKEIRHSLNLVDKGEYGSSISWCSSDKSYITDSGRVIRPRWYEENAHVTLTATIKCGYFENLKTFHFIVIKDEAWCDPGFMSDEEFFGVYENGVCIQSGKLNYTLPKLKKVEALVKDGDYSAAKQFLLEYFKNRDLKTVITAEKRNKLWADALLDDFYHLQSGAYFQGDMYVENVWDIYECKLSGGNIFPGAISCFSLRGRYNEASYAEVKKHNDENPLFRPCITLMVNGSEKTFYAIDSAQISAGKYATQNFASKESFRVQSFGEFLSDRTSYTVLKFDFSQLDADAEIFSAKLSVCAKACPGFSGQKRLIVLKEPSNTWKGDTAVWNDFLGCVYSYNGLPEKNNWRERPENSDIEYQYQMSRFTGYTTAILPEYIITKDESYMYKLLSILNDYLHDTGNYTMSDTKNYSPTGIRGGFTRSLDAAIKNENFLILIQYIAKSSMVTPEIFTAVLKNIWDTTNFLTVYNTPYNNWRQSEFQSVLQTTILLPEFYDCFNGKCWQKTAVSELENILFLNNLPDGSYTEAACGYSFSAFSLYVKHKIKMQEMGIGVSKEYDELLHKCAYYIALLFTPDGRQLQYGDNGVGLADMNIFKHIFEWYGDRELLYIVTKGSEGKKPSWTSKHWKNSTVTVMRSDFTADSSYLFTNVRGGGAHGHRDNNGVIVCAGRRTLLNDAGIFTYTSDDPYRKWGISTAAHNSVVINDTSQIHVEDAGTNATGKVYNWASNDKFDYLSQSTPNYPGFEHRRSIMFIKPRMWIISDLIIPAVENTVNNYKQTWHMLPDAGICVSTEDNLIYSSYPSGANIMIANADDDAALKAEMGYYDRSYQQIQSAPYAYFEKSLAGVASFDTVLLPVFEGDNAKLSAKKIVNALTETAILIEYELSGEKRVGYYYNSHENTSGNFDKYHTDAKAAYIEEDANGNVILFIIEGGTFIKNNENGKVFKN